MYVIYVVFIKITKMYKKLSDIKTTNFRICANIKNAFSFVSHFRIIYNYVSFQIQITFRLGSNYFGHFDFLFQLQRSDNKCFFKFLINIVHI